MRQIEVINDTLTPVVNQNSEVLTTDVVNEIVDNDLEKRKEYYKEKLESYVYVDDFKAALEVAYNTGMNLINWGNGGHG